MQWIGCRPFPSRYTPASCSELDCRTMQQVTVRVPGSTSNLGPGFDCLGVALRIYNDVTVIRGGKSQLPPIACEAARLFFERTGCAPFSLSVSTRGNVPVSRGLGSSVTARLGVLCALNALTGARLDRLSIFELCARLEGHPDNAAPAVFGGFTVVQSSASVSRALGKHGTRPAFQRFEVSLRLYFVLLIPQLEIRTSSARRILPSKISRAGAIENCANACAITAALASGNYVNLRGAFRDHLHQPYRAKLIPFLPSVIAAAEKAGALGAFLSGSGSTIAAVTLHSPKNIAAAMARAARTPAHTIITHADNRGARVLQPRIADH
jgi:homoserine kinase